MAKTGVVVADSDTNVDDLPSSMIYTDISGHPTPIDEIQNNSSVIIVITPHFICNVPRCLKTLETLVHRNQDNAFLSIKEIRDTFTTIPPNIIKQQFVLIYPEIDTDLSILTNLDDQILLLKAATEVMLRTYHSHLSLSNYYDEVETTPLCAQDPRLVENWNIVYENFTILQQAIFNNTRPARQSTEEIIEHIMANGELYLSYCEHSYPTRLQDILRPLITMFCIVEDDFITNYTNDIEESTTTADLIGNDSLE